MAAPPQTNPRRVIQVGPDKVTVLGQEVLIETQRPMPDWQVRELNPVPVYFEDRKYLLVQKRKGRPPYAASYLLRPWPKGEVSSTTRFHTYDAQTVAEREAAWRSGQAAEAVRLLLLPLYPFLGLLWSGTQNRLTRFGFVPRRLTRLSISAVMWCIIPASLMAILVSHGSPLVPVTTVIFIVAGLVDTVVRSHAYLRDEGWAGGFLEWLVPTVHDSPRPVEPPSPGFWASLDSLVWSSAEKEPSSTWRFKKKHSFRVPPIIERELRVALRKEQPARRRWRMAAGCTAAALVLSLVAGRSAGQDLHQLLCLAGFYVVVRVPQRLAGLFSAERKDQTLGLLFISGLRPSEVFVSKTLSAVVVVFSDLLAIMPLLALPFLMGGVSFELFLATACCLPNLLLFALAISLLSSVLSDDEGTSVMLTVWLVLALAAMPSAIYFAHQVFSASNKPLNWLLLWSPAYGPWLVFNRFSAGQAAAFWQNFFLTLSWSVLCLAVAGFTLARLWRERADSGPIYRWRERWRNVAHGTVSWRRRLAAEWLEANPFTWLAARDRRPATLAWIVVGAVTLIWLVCCALWPAKWPSVPNFFITATVLNLLLRWMIHYAAAARLALARRDGSYELLLTTPLPPIDIVRGQLDSLRRQFRNPCLVVLALEIAMLTAGLGLRRWDSTSLLVYFMLWSGLLFWEWNQSWNPRSTLLSMWAGLNSARPAQAVWRVMGFNSWVWVWILFNLRQGVRGLHNFPSGSLGEVLFVVAGGFIILAMFLRSRLAAGVLQRRLAAEFREIVREPLPDPHDPRFKQWNVRERFPWGWAIVQEQLHERLARREADGI